MGNLYASIKAILMMLWNLMFHTSPSETKTTIGGESTGRRCIVPTSNGANARDGTSKQSNSNSASNQMDYNSPSWDSLIESSEDEQVPPWSSTSKLASESEPTPSSSLSTSEPTEFSRLIEAAAKELRQRMVESMERANQQREKEIGSPPPTTTPAKEPTLDYGGQVGTLAGLPITYNPSNDPYFSVSSGLARRRAIANSAQSESTAPTLMSLAGKCGNPSCIICEGAK